MKRNPFARKISSLLQKAHFLNQNPKISSDELFDRIDDLEEMRSRREFLKKSAILPAGLVLSSSFLEACACMCKKDAAAKSKVLILGGGMSGLVAAYYLTKAKIPCEIYESSSRSGGRVFSKYNFNQDHMFCELGGELIDTNNQDVIQLCKDFSIEIDPFAPYDKGLLSNLYFIKNKFYTDRQLIPAFRKLAHALQTAKAASLESIDRLSLEEYLRSLKNVEPWVIDLLRVAYVGESGVEADKQSAYLMVGTIDSDFSHGVKFFGESDEALKIRGGNSRLAGAIEKYLVQNGVEIHFDTPLVSIHEKSQKLELSFQKDHSKISVLADQVICTIPFTRLREVEGIAQLALNSKKLACIQQMQYATNSKLMLGFKSRFWRERAPHKSNGMVYTDLLNQNFWESSRLQDGQSGILTSFTGGNAGARLSVDQSPQYLQTMNQVFPGLKDLYDSNLAAFNWSQYKHTKGSYASYAPGQITEFGDISSAPELSGRLLFAGEHATKEFQGFINGAAYSGRRAAEKVIAGTAVQSSSS